MKTAKKLSIIFQSIQGAGIIIFLLTLLNWDWLKLINPNYVALGILGIFWVFMNVVTWVSILSKE